MNKGKIVQVVGPVVDVEFTEKLPDIYGALTVDFKVANEPFNLTLEVQQHLGDHWVRTISMSGTEGLKRGYEAIDTGAPISVPVGEGVMGRIFDVCGNPVDERGPVKAEKRYPIHRPAPKLVDQSPSPASSAHWHQGHRFDLPFPERRQGRCIRRCRHGQDGHHHGADQQYRQAPRGCIGIRWRR